MTTTQVGGKYHPEDDSVFRTKKLLVQLGVQVTHPIADEIQANTEHHALAFNPNEIAFNDVERHYYESIRTCDFHTVCNRFKGDIGYIGGSASLELAFAMCHRRPIVLLHHARLASSVNPSVRGFLLKRLRQVRVHNFLGSDATQNVSAIATIRSRQVDYDVTVNEQQEIQRHVDGLIRDLAIEHAAT